jgi:uncharacterized protein (DUF427 family)
VRSVAYFPRADVSPGWLVCEDRVTLHPELGPVEWFDVESAQREVVNAAWHFTALPPYAAALTDRIAFAWQAMNGFFEEDERLVGHASDPNQRIDIRAASRHLMVRDGNRVIVDTDRSLVLFESGRAPRWYVAWADVDRSALRLVDRQTLCPYKGVASHYDVGSRANAAWSYGRAFPEASRVQDCVSFEPARIDVFLDGKRLDPDPRPTAIAQSTHCGMDPAEAMYRDA